MPATTAEPLVSIIIPTYNRASLITAAVETALRQTWKAAEVIVVDDGSTDDTRQRLGCFGSRIRLISRANGGAAAAPERRCCSCGWRVLGVSRLR